MSNDFVITCKDLPSVSCQPDAVAPVKFAAAEGCERVIVSPMKLPVGRYTRKDFKDKFRKLYGEPFGGKPATRSFTWRPPEPYVHEILIGEVKELCQRHGIPLVGCKTNLITTP